MGVVVVVYILRMSSIEDVVLVVNSFVAMNVDVELESGYGVLVVVVACG